LVEPSHDRRRQRDSIGGRPPGREDPTTAEERSAEIESLRRQQAAQRKLRLRLGFANNRMAVLAGRRRLIKIAITGNDPPPTMTFIVMTYIFPASF